jgi:hypothetical protein
MRETQSTVTELGMTVEQERSVGDQSRGAVQPVSRDLGPWLTGLTGG